MQQRISRVISRDGTAIAYERSGHGPPVILVMGAFNDRGTGAPLAESLAPDFTVFTYDRRGRGDSGDTAPYAVEREIEDLAALLGAAGGSAAVFGFSSGAVLGVTAWRVAFDRPRAGLGLQPETVGSAATWVVPNPSGLNAHYQLPDLARIYGELRPGR